MRARLIGPFLMVAFGVALLLGPAQSTAVDAGTTTPCTTLPATPGIQDPCSTTTTTLCVQVDAAPAAIIVNPCTSTTAATTTTINCGLTQGVVIVEPCATTTAPPTTVIDPCDDQTGTLGAVSPCTTTTAVATTLAPTVPSTVDETTTTEDSGVSGVDDSQTTTTPAAAPAAVNSGTLPRTGSNDLPLTAAAIGLIVLGTGLAVAERRHQVQRNRS